MELDLVGTAGKAFGELLPHLLSSSKIAHYFFRRIPGLIREPPYPISIRNLEKTPRELPREPIPTPA